MLVLSRHMNERYVMLLPDGQAIWIMTVAVTGDKVRHGIDAPKEIKILREEVYRQILAEKGLQPTRSA